MHSPDHVLIIRNRPEKRTLVETSEVVMYLYLIHKTPSFLIWCRLCHASADSESWHHTMSDGTNLTAFREVPQAARQLKLIQSRSRNNVYDLI